MIQDIKSCQDEVNKVKTTLSDSEIFMGPIADSCKEELAKIDSFLSTLSENYNTIANYLVDCSSNYKAGDKNASIKVITVGSDGKISVTKAGVVPGNIVKTVEIPSDLEQRGYTVTCYGPEGWWFGGTDLRAIAAGSSQEAVHNVWNSQNSQFKNDIAIINQDGVDYYLVATAESLGEVGDRINVTFEDGSSIPCIVADAKSSADSNYTYYGHAGDGGVNILEFEVNKDKYNATGTNPTTEGWGLEWDSNSKVTKVDNYGSIFTNA